MSAAAHAAEVVLGALLLGGGWYVHARLFPKKVCPRCHGTKRIAGGFATFHRLPRCNKTGEGRRWGSGSS